MYRKCSQYMSSKLFSCGVFQLNVFLALPFLFEKEI